MILKQDKSRKHTLRHFTGKLKNTKGKEKGLKAAGERRQITYKKTIARLTTDFSTAITESRKQWNNTFKVLMENNCQSKIYTQLNHTLRMRMKQGHFRQTTTKKVFNLLSLKNL